MTEQVNEIIDNYRYTTAAASFVMLVYLVAIWLMFYETVVYALIASVFVALLGLLVVYLVYCWSVRRIHAINYRYENLESVR